MAGSGLKICRWPATTMDNNRLTRSNTKAACKRAKCEQKAKEKAKRKRQDARREPRECITPDCIRQVRCGCRLCEPCYQQKSPPKEAIPLLCQGCPSLAHPTRRSEHIRWALDAPGLANWVHENLELTVTKGCKSSSAKWILVAGWRGRNDLDEQWTVDGTQTVAQ